MLAACLDELPQRFSLLQVAQRCALARLAPQAENSLERYLGLYSYIFVMPLRTAVARGKRGCLKSRFSVSIDGCFLVY